MDALVTLGNQTGPVIDLDPGEAVEQLPVDCELLKVLQD